MTDENGINPELLQPEDVVKPKRVRKPKVAKTEEPAVEAKEEETVEPGWKYTYTYNHPEYDMYMAYQKYFEQQQKSILDYWTTVMKNIWNPFK